MKDLVIGVVMGVLIMGTAAKAVNITMENVTVMDMYRGFALAGILSSTGIGTDIDARVSYAIKCADEMFKRRGK